MKPGFFVLSLVFFTLSVRAGRITGLVTDNKNHVLPFASILIKGTVRGSTANQEGRYFLQLEPGKYTIVCQYVGYQRQEKTVTVGNDDQVLDFRLVVQQTSMKEFIVKAGAEDPAYAIIRNAIKERSNHLNEVESFQCEVYVKGMLKLRGYPDKFMGKVVDMGDNDTSKLKMLYFSESVATYSFRKPDKSKIEVSSTKVSGQSNAFGMSQLQIISFYENNILLFPNLNPRGFVSPIADNALHFYRYKLLGVFFEEGREINKIRVTAKRKFEPLFSGIINITENDWRIHSLQLLLTKESQMDMLDTLRIEQLFVPLDNRRWVIKNQVIYPAIKIFGFDTYGSFINNYTDFNVNPSFDEKFFNNTVLKYQDSSNKRSLLYWDSIRPLPLQEEEIKDYKKKDSLEQLRRSPAFLDSIDRKRNRFNLVSLITTGQTFTKRKKRASFSVIPIIDALNFNTAEGMVINLSGTYTKRRDSSMLSRKIFQMTPTLRYGFSNHHLNAGLASSYSFGIKHISVLSSSGGKQVFQFNNEMPIRERDNTLTTLLLEKNLMKTYEAVYGTIGFSRELGAGISISALASYQDRMPLENTSGYIFRESYKRQYTPNFPVELMAGNIVRHQALTTTASLNWQPASRYVEFPDRKINIGSKYPTFQLTYTKGVNGWFGSDIDYDKWRILISDELNMKLAGRFDYRVSVGGFLNRNKVEVPDFQHFKGNQVFFSAAYLQSFQVAPYYLNSTTASFYATINAEYQLKGLITNKLPFIRRLNWQVVTGSNAFYINNMNNYMEAFVGLENIFRLFRVDFIQSFSRGRKARSGITIGLQGAVFGN